ncbi:helix-turn-helix domain-containing protein [Streptomyces sp. PTD5-9]|uniref:helix-turn-helix domain-containing protein n=1 Tax=Streptomyces sp. PTD5-9 TaxID=3120150 RepID=UPI00300A7D2C
MADREVDGGRRTTISDIVEEAQMSRPTVYKYAGTKDEAFARIVRMGLEQAAAAAERAAARAYRDQRAWRDLQRFLPERLRLTDETAPQEEFWDWCGHRVHLDRCPNPAARAKVVLHHGVGTNGRQMSLILGSPLARRGFEMVALDNLGYGLRRHRGLRHQKRLLLPAPGPQTAEPTRRPSRAGCGASSPWVADLAFY